MGNVLYSGSQLVVLSEQGFPNLSRREQVKNLVHAKLGSIRLAALENLQFDMEDNIVDVMCKKIDIACLWKSKWRGIKARNKECTSYYVQMWIRLGME